MRGIKSKGCRTQTGEWLQNILQVFSQSLRDHFPAPSVPGDIEARSCKVI